MMKTLTLSIIFLAHVAMVYGRAFRHRKLVERPYNAEPIKNQYLFELVPNANGMEVLKTLIQIRRQSRQFLRKRDNDSVSKLRSINGVDFITMSNVPDDVLEMMLENENIKLAEEDQVVTADRNVQYRAPWNLDRLDDGPGESNLFDRRYAWSYTGKGVDVYVIDTGIRLTHEEFQGRASCGYDSYDEGCRDSYGHGTHVAGTIGGVTYGVAKGVNLIAVRVLGANGGGSVSNVIDGINYVTEQKLANPSRPAVVNMSLGSGVSVTENQAIARAVEAGVVFSVSAGNNNGDACQKSPASAEQAITVASSTNSDTRSSFSNFGECVDIFAPGSDVVSAYITDDQSSKSMSGTSMAAPAVAGVAALLLEKYTDFTPEEVWAEMFAISDFAGSEAAQAQSNLNMIVSTKELINVEDACGDFLAVCSTDAECCTDSCRLGRCFLF